MQHVCRTSHWQIMVGRSPIYALLAHCILLEKSHILSNMLLKKSHMLLKKSNSAPENSTSTDLEVLIIQDRQLNGGSYDGVVLGTCA